MKKKTFMAKKEEVSRKWYLIDADGQAVGRLATKLADILRGKNKATFTPHVDTGDFIVVVNAEKVKFTGNKEEQKVYKNYSGYPGGLKQTTAKEMRVKDPEYLVEHAVKSMLPKSKLGRAIIKKLKVYAGSEHQHAAQSPELLKV